MNYLQFVNNVLDTAKSHKLVYEVGEGDIYEHLNSGDHKYPCVFLTVQNIDYNGSQMTVTGSLFYVDALLSDTSNKLQIQATGMTTLQQIFMRLMDNYPDFDLRTGRYTPFDEKFSDLCAGVFSNFTISFMDDICIVNDDIFEGDVPTPPTPPGPEPPTPPTPPTPPEPEGKYMTIRVLDGTEGTVISPTVNGSITPPNLQYRINSNGDWNDFIFGKTEYIHLVAGDFVQFKGVNESGISVDYNNYLKFDISGNSVGLSGNVMSLIDGVGDTLVIPKSFCFCNLFSKSNIKTVSSDFLPATTLASHCYERMFYRCTSLTTAPALPATTLVGHCYEDMFWGCTSLKTAPVLPATTLAEWCYWTMFRDCTSLTKAPELPAMELANSCYDCMFQDCTSLTTAPELPATTLSGGCYYGMFSGCTALTTAPELPATTISERCYESMFNGCTSLTTAPVLPATTLENRCYDSMFKGCTSLTTAPVLPTTTLSERCYESMFSGCTALTTAPVLPAKTLVFQCYERMFKDCKKLSYVKCLSTKADKNATWNWLDGVASYGTFVKPNYVSYETGSSGIPSGWRVSNI